MNGTTLTRLVFTIVIGLLMAVASTANAQGAQPPLQQPVFAFPADSDTPVISYSSTPEMLGDPDTSPRIQVFGDGWVWVHYPVYMKKAGDYELYLHPGEVHQLLVAMSGVFDFDANAVGLSLKAIKDAQELIDGRLSYRSEDSAERFEVLLDSYQPGPAAPGQAINLDLSWRNIAADARDYPQLDKLQKLNNAMHSLRALLSRDDLVKVDSPAGNGSAR